MTRRLYPLLLSLAIATAGCGQAHAERVALASDVPMPVAPDAPYRVELLGERGDVLPSFERGGRFYVLGRAKERYSVRVKNPTPRRVEAVISVDGLDAIDGESGDYQRKRGYIVPPGGDLVVAGWRVSTREVASFRFSSVASSYAGRKGKAREVGVIGVAIFEEREAPEIVLEPVPRPVPPPLPRPYYRNRPDHGAAPEAESDAPPPPARPRATRAPKPGAGSVTHAPAPGAGSAGDTAPRAAESRRVPHHHRHDRTRGTRRERSRPGLGTEFGERQSSAVSFTHFVRRDPARPDAIAVLRYNDAAGLRALGIPVESEPDTHELLTRETANPFPAVRFAEPVP